MSSISKIILSVIVTALVVGSGTYYLLKNQSVAKPTTTTAPAKALTVNEQLARVLSIDAEAMNKILLEDVLKPTLGTVTLVGVSETNNCSAFEGACGRTLTQEEHDSIGVQDPLFVYETTKEITPTDMKKLQNQLNKSQYPVQESTASSILAHGAGGDNTFLSITADVNDTGRFQIRVLVY
ncbi:MAG TPA: hypothetical protein VLE93_03595 [Candidatus Saccharimonadales bacterium]|nr:hypothetical protein [Candidatus Saccharimonadales bacterium]